MVKVQNRWVNSKQRIPGKLHGIRDGYFFLVFCFVIHTCHRLLMIAFIFLTKTVFNFKSDKLFPGCGGILTGSDGTITSPGHPEVYPHGVVCMWVIKGKPGEIVRLTWDSFSLEASSNCRWDVVEIYDNSTSFVNGSLVGRYVYSLFMPTF